jgi:hypothetical protein
MEQVLRFCEYADFRKEITNQDGHSCFDNDTYWSYWEVGGTLYSIRMHIHPQGDEILSWKERAKNMLKIGSLRNVLLKYTKKYAKKYPERVNVDKDVFPHLEKRFIECMKNPEFAAKFTPEFFFYNIRGLIKTDKEFIKFDRLCNAYYKPKLGKIIYPDDPEQSTQI